MLTPTLLLVLCAAPGTPGDAAIPAPGGRLLSLGETLEPQGAPGMMDMSPRPRGSPTHVGRPRWSAGQTLMQGYFGAVFFEEISSSGGGVPPIENTDSDAASMPTIGGGAMYKMGGERLDWGFEGMLAFSGQANAAAFYIGGGGAAVAVDVDLLVFELYGGPFVSVFLGEKLRLYGAAGPLMEWAEFDQQGSSPTDSGSGSGFGVGGYARAGLELILGRGTMVGVGARWAQSTVDLSGDVGDLDLSELQTVLTVTTGL